MPNTSNIWGAIAPLPPVKFVPGKGEILKYYTTSTKHELNSIIINFWGHLDNEIRLKTLITELNIVKEYFSLNLPEILKNPKMNFEFFENPSMANI